MWRINPLRCAWGTVPAFTPMNNGSVALFNNSTGAHLINVLMLSAGSFQNGLGSVRVSKTRLTNQAVGTISPVVTDEAIPVGLLDSDDLATIPPSTFIGSVSFPPFNQGNSYPIAVLRPGWGIQATASSPGAIGDFSFFYEWCYAEELFRLSAGDSADGE